MRSRLLLRRLLRLLEEIDMPFPIAGEPASRPIFNAAISTATNVGPATGGIVHTITVTNLSASALNATVSDTTGQIGTLEVPAHDMRELPFGHNGAKYTGQLSVTPSAAADVTVVVQ